MKNKTILIIAAILVTVSCDNNGINYGIDIPVVNSLDVTTKIEAHQYIAKKTELDEKFASDGTVLLVSKCEKPIKETVALTEGQSARIGGTLTIKPVHTSINPKEPVGHTIALMPSNDTDYDIWYEGPEIAVGGVTATLQSARLTRTEKTKNIYYSNGAYAPGDGEAKPLPENIERKLKGAPYETVTLSQFEVSATESQKAEANARDNIESICRTKGSGSPEAYQFTYKASLMTPLVYRKGESFSFTFNLKDIGFNPSLLFGKINKQYETTATVTSTLPFTISIKGYNGKDFKTTVNENISPGNTETPTTTSFKIGLTNKLSNNMLKNQGADPIIQITLTTENDNVTINKRDYVEINLNGLKQSIK